MTTTLDLRDLEEAQLLSGPRDQHLRLLREQFHVDVVIRGGKLHVSGDDAAAAGRLLVELLEHIRATGSLSTEEVEQTLQAARRAAAATPTDGAPTGGLVPREGSKESARLPSASLHGFKLRTDGQRHYVGEIQQHDVVFAVGPAGTGKTFLAVLMAVQALKAGQVERIVLCRPAVEAGEKLGFLPGDFHAKVNPYMRPLYDALYAMLDFETVKKYLEHEVVEVAPLAYMRGRTLNRAFIILDEAQNTTRSQMKMFLTRMGERSKIVVTGDVTQIDLPSGEVSGLVHALSILRKTAGVSLVELTAKDIVRHQLVWRILQAYDADDEERQGKPAGGSGGRGRGDRGRRRSRTV